MSQSNYIHLSFEKILRETDKALLIRFPDAEEDLWIPLSQIADPEDFKAGDKDGEISVTEWIAKEKGLNQD